jgi:hypothetical protein
MRTRTLAAAGAAAMVLGLGSAPPISAQLGPGPENPARPVASEQDDASYGWIGVLGLVGLLGLVGARNRTTDEEHDFAGGRSHAKTPPVR